MRYRFARRWCLANSILFITTIITLASVINTPPTLLISTQSRNDAIENTSIIQSSLNTSDTPGDISTTNIPPNDSTSNDNGNVINSTAIESTTTLVSTNRTENATQVGAGALNSTSKNQENITIIPDVCQGLEIMDGDRYIDENDKWWLSMASFNGNI